ncbi:hypothetical protein FACS189494_05230 [Spirochaetia bacterium]|nr:hypothetical protein FACS189494_05230 [Spirochaetia bacterium]
MQTAFNSFADSNLTKPLSYLTNLLNKLAEDPERIKKVFSGIAMGIGAIAAVKGIAGISRLVGSLSQLKSGNLNITESLNMASAMPVYVTNWGGGAVPFVYGDMHLSGGQTVDTGEYAFYGLWTNNTLNEKVQTITVNGFIRGDTYIKNRNALINALRVHTGDDAPGFIDLPLWGRFPVVVTGYTVGEEADAGGGCAVSLTFIRQGVTVDEREKLAAAVADAKDYTIEAAGKFKAVILKDLLNKKLDLNTLTSVLNKMKTGLLGILGRIQGAINIINNISSEISGITSLIAQGAGSPELLAQAVVNAVSGIVAGLSEIKNAAVPAGGYFSSGSGEAAGAGPAGYFLIRDNEKNTLLAFLENIKFDAGMETATVIGEQTKNAAENFCKTVSFYAAALILPRLDNASYQQTLSYWTLFSQLEESLDLNNPDVYKAVQDIRIAVSLELSARLLSNEQEKYITAAAPLLFLSQFLGSDEDKIREYNGIIDSFVIKGAIKYV